MIGAVLFGAGTWLALRQAPGLWREVQGLWKEIQKGLDDSPSID